MTHIGAENNRQNNLATLSPLRLAQIHKNVAVFLLQGLIQHDAVHILQRRAIVMLEREFMLRLHEKQVVNTWVADIVGQRADQQTKHFERSEHYIQLRNHD